LISTRTECIDRERPICDIEPSTRRQGACINPGHTGVGHTVEDPLELGPINWIVAQRSHSHAHAADGKCGIERESCCSRRARGFFLAESVCIVDDTGKIIREVKLASEP